MECQETTYSHNHKIQRLKEAHTPLRPTIELLPHPLRSCSVLNPLQQPTCYENCDTAPQLENQKFTPTQIPEAKSPCKYNLLLQQNHKFLVNVVKLQDLKKIKFLL